MHADENEHLHIEFAISYWYSIRYEALRYHLLVDLVHIEFQ